MATMTAKKIENLAKDIHSFLVNREMWIDANIYFNGKCWSTSNELDTEFCYNENRYFEYEANPKCYFEYVANPHILSMSFEGILYDVLNGYSYGWTKTEADFKAIFEKYGLYFELGNAWNLTCFEV